MITLHPSTQHALEELCPLLSNVAPVQFDRKYAALPYASYADSA